MSLEQFSIVAVLLLTVFSFVLFISEEWRWSLIALAVQYVAVFWLVGLNWSIGLAAVKLASGWMAAAILSASQATMQLEEAHFGGRSGQIFRLMVGGLALALAFSAEPALARALPGQPTVLWGGMILIGMGLLQLGMTAQPLRAMLGLLTLLSGFEILYAVVEFSVLVAGLLALVTLGLALAGAYLAAAPDMEGGE